MSNSVLVIATGGTIACTTNADGARVPTLTAADLIARSGRSAEPYDAISLDSSAITFADLDLLLELLLADATSTSPIVLTHGTDSLAETALAIDLVLPAGRTVVLTGAQLPDDHPYADGPANLRGAIDIAANPPGPGVFVHFGGDTLPARGLYKCSTQSLRAFALTTDTPAARPAPVPRAPLADLKVPILRAWPGADASLVDHVANSGVDGIVIEALGSGNVSDPMGAAIARACERGIPVVIATSVPHGGVEFAYGGAGGGATLGTVGALPAGPLSAGQARIALATSLASGTDPRLVL